MKPTERELLKINTAYAVGRSEGERAAERRVFDEVIAVVNGWVESKSCCPGETCEHILTATGIRAAIRAAFPELAKGEEPQK